MPELPEVETTKLGLERLIVTQIIQSVDILYPSLRWIIPVHLSHCLNDLQILGISRVAKYILLEFNQGDLIIHLGMSGSISVVKQIETLQKHEHFVLNLKNGNSMRLKDPRRFGAVLWQNKGDTHPLLANLGLEPLSSAFNTKYLYSTFKGKKRSIKALIMDSKIVVGVGNIYVLEALFMAKISPLMPVNELSKKQTSQLIKTIKTVLKNAIKQGGTTLKDFSRVDKQAGYFTQELQVYGRANQPCLSCSDIITRVVQNNRSSFYCPSCQQY